MGEHCGRMKAGGTWGWSGCRLVVVGEWVDERCAVGCNGVNTFAFRVRRTYVCTHPLAPAHKTTLTLRLDDRLSAHTPTLPRSLARAQSVSPCTHAHTHTRTRPCKCKDTMGHHGGVAQTWAVGGMLWSGGVCAHCRVCEREREREWEGVGGG